MTDLVPAGPMRHLLTGTVCPGMRCEECLLASCLTGNIYLTRELPDD